MSWDYYSMGNTDIVFTMLDNISLMTGANSAYTTIVFVVAMIAFSVLLGGAMFKMSAGPVTSWFFGFVILWSGFFIPKVDMNIINTTNPTNVRVIQNMPLGLAFIGQVTSTFGKWFTDISEQVFTPIGAATYSDAGMVFGANAIFEARRANLAKMSPKMQADFNSFFSGCMQHDIALYNKYSGEDLLNSTDILTLMAKTNRALTTEVYNSSTGVRELMYCDIAYDHIKNNVAKVFGSANAGRTGYTIFARMDANAESAQKRDYPKIMKNVENTYQNIFNANRVGATKIIEQELLINAVRSAYIANMREVGAQDNVQAAVGSVNAEAALLAQQNTNWAVAYKYLPIAQNTIEAVLLSIFPIVIMIAILGGLAMFNTIMMYALTLLWIKLWPGLFAIVNGIALMYQNNATEAIRLDAGGMTWNNSYDVLSVANSTQAFAGAMCMIVPVLAWGLIKLAQGGLQAGFGMMAGAPQKAADASGSAAGVGNTSYGTGTYNTGMGNKTNFTEQSTNASGTTTTSPNGGKYFTSSLPVKASQSFAKGEEFSRQAANKFEAADQQSAKHTESVTRATGSAAQFASTQGADFNKSVGSSNVLSAQARQTFSEAQKNAQSIAQEHGFGNDQAVMSVISAGITGGISTGSVPNIGVNLGGKVTQQDSEKITQSMKDSVNTMKSQGYTVDQSYAEAVASTKEFKSAESAGDKLTQTTSSELKSADGYARESQRLYKEGQTLQTQATQAYKESLSISADVPLTQQQMDVISRSDLTTPEGVKAAVTAIAGENGVTAPNDYKTYSSDIGQKISNTKNQIPQTYNQGVQRVIGQGGRDLSSVVATANSAGVGVGDVSGDVNAGYNQANESIGATKTAVGAGAQGVGAEGNVISTNAKQLRTPSTSTQIVGYGAAKDMQGLANNLNAGVGYDKKGEINHPKGQGGESPQEPQPKRKLVAPRHQRRR